MAQKSFSVLACTPPSCSNAAKYDKGINYKYKIIFMEKL
jgi:hypothetical protein